MIHGPRSRGRLVASFSVALVVLVAAACGSSSRSATPPSTGPDGSTTLPSTSPTTQATVAPTTPSTDIDHPSDPQVALLRLGAPGQMPDLVIGGDGYVYSAKGVAEVPQPQETDAASAASGRGFQPAAVPPPPPPAAVTRRKLTEQGIENLLRSARSFGLLQPVTYTDPGITDASTTYLLITDANGAYEHDAYALGIGDETGARLRLQQFVASLADLDSLVGNDNIGPAEAYTPKVYNVTKGGFAYYPGNEPHWPAAVSFSEGCLPLQAADGFLAGVAGVYVIDTDASGNSERASVLPDLPGDPC